MQMARCVTDQLCTGLFCLPFMFESPKNDVRPRENSRMIAGETMLRVVSEADISRLMSWFPTGQSVDIWGGPKFRYPYTPQTFDEDVCWRQIDSYCLVDPADEMLAFGQIYERHERINLARLVVAPQQRGRGIGKQLIALLMEKGRARFPLRAYSLYVYKDNHPARACYVGMGFREHRFPVDDEMAGTCIYMTRPVAHGPDP